jgi:hypothetical protein
MKRIYSDHAIDAAMADMLEAIRWIGTYHPATTESLIADLVGKHPIIGELEECGPHGYCGIGLGKMDGHVIGEE